MQRLLVTLLVLVPLAGCAHYGAEFTPALAAQTVWGAKNTGVSTEEGMTVTVNGQRWGGSPEELGAIVTPLEVTITNRSGQPVRLTHEMFALVSPSGVSVQALSPYEIQRPGTRGYYGPYSSWGLGWGGPWGGWYGPGGYGPWGYGPWGYGYGAWGYGGWGPSYYYSEPLPSRDMLHSALPEGELADGGTAHGYVYFPHVGEDVGRVTFKANMVSTETGKSIAEIQVPLLARG